MTISNHNGINRYSLADTIRARVCSYLDKIYDNDAGLLGNLDSWTRRRITEENMAKLALVLDAESPAEACYADLIREIDTEAETGIYLARADASSRHLRRVADEPGVSGEMHLEIATIAPILYADETSRSNDEFDLVWVTIQALHDRAHADATVSEIIMSFLVDNAETARDMSTAIRALQYPFHENAVRCRCQLPRTLGDREERELLIMITELARRSGSYEERIIEIRDRVATH